MSEISVIILFRFALHKNISLVQLLKSKKPLKKLSGFLMLLKIYKGIPNEILNVLNLFLSLAPLSL